MKFNPYAVIGVLLGWFVVTPLLKNPTPAFIGETCLGLIMAILFGIFFWNISS